MNFVELTRANGTRYLFDIESGWEIDDHGDKPARWGNNKQGRNNDCAEPYEVVKKRLLGIVDVDGDGERIVQVSGFGVANTMQTQCNYMLVALTAAGRVLMSRGDGIWADVSNKAESP